jgi:death on curing protein
VIYLSLPELLHVAERTISPDVQVRDHGLLEAAVARPQTSVFGADAYPGLNEKAAALVHSIVGNHALVDGNKRLGLAALLAFLGVNGSRLTMTNDEAYEFIMRIARGELRDVAEIATVLQSATEPRP